MRPSKTKNPGVPYKPEGPLPCLRFVCLVLLHLLRILGLAWPLLCFPCLFFVFIFSLVTLRNSGEKCYSLVFVLWLIFFLEFESHEKDERKPDYCSTQVLWRLISNRAIFIWSFSFSPRSPTFFVSELFVWEVEPPLGVHSPGTCIGWDWAASKPCGSRPGAASASASP